MKLALVKWVDACGPTDKWVRKPDYGNHDFTPVICQTVGWVKEAGDHLEVIQSIADYCSPDNEQYTGVMTIPRGCVIEVRSLLLTSRI